MQIVFKFRAYLYGSVHNTLNWPIQQQGPSERGSHFDCLVNDKKLNYFKVDLYFGILNAKSGVQFKVFNGVKETRTYNIVSHTVLASRSPINLRASRYPFYDI